MRSTYDLSGKLQARPVDGPLEKECFDFDNAREIIEFQVPLV